LRFFTLHDRYTGYGSSKTASVKVKARAKKNAPIYGVEKFHCVQKMRKAGFAAHGVFKLRYVQRESND